MAQPFWLIGVVFQIHARYKSFIATHNDHDEQIGNHDHVNERQDHQHDDGLIQLSDGGINFVTNAIDQSL